jgi:hypothetical protein
MRPTLLVSTALLAFTATAAAQNPPTPPSPPTPPAPTAQPKPPAPYAAPAQRPAIKLSDVAGTWNGQSMIGPKDSVVVTYVFTATADAKGWTVTFPNREPIPTRVVSTGGDSIVTETGPYQSVLRPAQTVVTRITQHYTGGDTMTGTFEAHYSSGDVLKGKIVSTRKK